MAPIIEEEPIAAASIGQVYRARLHDGRTVAVKVQYPGVAAAVRADMQNMDMIMRLLNPRPEIRQLLELTQMQQLFEIVQR